MKKRVAILQSNYIPWKGYFDIIGMVDLFIFHDDLQFTKNDWRNRNKIKTPNRTEWLTIPVGTNEHRLINEVELNDPGWQRKHWQKLKLNYKEAPSYTSVAPFFEEIYLGMRWKNLSELNQHIIECICRSWLDIATNFKNSSAYNLTGKKEQRVLELLQKCGATTYVSGPAAKNYLHQENFEKESVELEWMDYSGYQEYPQLYPPFEHAVSIVDLLFNTGKEAKQYLKYSQLHA